MKVPKEEKIGEDLLDSSVMIISARPHQEIVEALTCLVRVDHVAALRDIGFNV